MQHNHYDISGRHPILSAAQTDGEGRGRLQVDVTSALNNFPIPGAVVTIASTDDPNQILEQLGTNTSGQTEEVTLPTPALEYSMIPNQDVRPYAEYTLVIRAPGYEPLTITGTEVLPDTTAIQDAHLVPLAEGLPESPIFIPDHTLYGDYPAKIPEAEIKPMPETGEIVLSRVVVPELSLIHI